MVPYAGIIAYDNNDVIDSVKKSCIRLGRVAASNPTRVTIHEDFVRGGPIVSRSNLLRCLLVPEFLQRIRCPV